MSYIEVNLEHNTLGTPPLLKTRAPALAKDVLQVIYSGGRGGTLEAVDDPDVVLLGETLLQAGNYIFKPAPHPDQDYLHLMHEMSENIKYLMSVTELSLMPLQDDFRADLSTTSSGPHVEEFNFRLNREYLGINKRTTTKTCMVTGLILPSNEVKASHIYPRRQEHRVKRLLNFVDVNDVRNGMLWCTPVEMAFSDSGICFSWDLEKNSPVLHIIDKALFGMTLLDIHLHYLKKKESIRVKKSNSQSQKLDIPPRVPQLDQNLTKEVREKYESFKLDTINHRVISYDFGKGTRPYKRAFAFMAKLAISLARDRGTLPYDFLQSDWHWTVSEDGWAEKTKLWMKGACFQDPPPEAELDLCDPLILDSAQLSLFSDVDIFDSPEYE